MRLWISQAVISESRGLLLRQLERKDSGSSIIPSFTNPVALTLNRTFDDETARCGKEYVRVLGKHYKTGDNFKRFMLAVLKGQEKPGYVTIHNL